MSDYFCDTIMPVKILIDVFQPSQCRIFSIVLISFFFNFIDTVKSALFEKIQILNTVLKPMA